VSTERDSQHGEGAGPRKLVHVARIAVRWRDMDVNRHVNNTIYFRYLEQARIEWFDSVVEERRDPYHGIVIANAYCNYLKPLAYPATIDVCVYVGPPGRSSFTFYYDVYLEHDRTLKYADGYTRAVWVDRRSGRSAPLPEYFRRHLS
jgi:acyl-CoA thioester hydrolase